MAKTVEVFNEQGESTQLRLFPSDAEVPDDPQVARVLVKKVRVERTRKFGDCYLARVYQPRSENMLRSRY
jgi:hypothetical protein